MDFGRFGPPREPRKARVERYRALEEPRSTKNGRGSAPLQQPTARIEPGRAPAEPCGRTFAQPDTAKVAAFGLSGKRILCVGGRTNLVQHYRALVESHGGELLHHDGGLEESLDAVTRARTTVDAVLCPIDCVSHAATLKVKRACKHLSKDFIVLRSSGLSSFARGIRTIALGESGPRGIEG